MNVLLSEYAQRLLSHIIGKSEIFKNFFSGHNILFDFNLQRDIHSVMTKQQIMSH